MKDYKDENTLLMFGDVRLRLADVPDKSVDLFCVDLPYGQTANSWDSPINLQYLWGQLERIAKGGGVFVFTSMQPFTTSLINSNAAFFRRALVWKKNSPTGHLSAKRKEMRNHEDILIFCEREPIYNPQGLSKLGKAIRVSAAHPNWKRQNAAGEMRVREKTGYPKTVLEFDVERGEHPTQKPVALMDYLVRTYSNEGATVLDCCMGSGTTGVAARNAGRKFIGIERDPQHFKTSFRRICL